MNIDFTVMECFTTKLECTFWVYRLMKCEILNNFVHSKNLLICKYTASLLHIFLSVHSCKAFVHNFCQNGYMLEMNQHRKISSLVYGSFICLAWFLSRMLGMSKHSQIDLINKKMSLRNYLSIILILLEITGLIL